MFFNNLDSARNGGFNARSPAYSSRLSSPKLKPHWPNDDTSTKHSESPSFRNPDPPTVTKATGKADKDNANSPGHPHEKLVQEIVSGMNVAGSDRIAAWGKHNSNSKKTGYMHVPLHKFVSWHRRMKLVELVQAVCSVTPSAAALPSHLQDEPFELSLIGTEQGVYATLPDAVLADPNSTTFRNAVTLEENFSRINHSRIDARALYRRLGPDTLLAEIVSFKPSAIRSHAFVYCAPFPVLWTAVLVQIARRLRGGRGQSQKSKSALHTTIQQWPVVQLLEIAFPGILQDATTQFTPEDSAMVAPRKRGRSETSSKDPPLKRRLQNDFDVTSRTQIEEIDSSASANSTDHNDADAESAVSIHSSSHGARSPGLEDSRIMDVTTPLPSSSQDAEVTATATATTITQRTPVQSGTTVGLFFSPHHHTPGLASGQTARSSFAACRQMLAIARAKMYAWTNEHFQNAESAAVQRLLRFDLAQSGLFDIDPPHQGKPSTQYYPVLHVDPFIAIWIQHKHIVATLSERLCHAPLDHQLRRTASPNAVVYTCPDVAQCNQDMRPIQRILLQRFNLLLESPHVNTDPIISAFLAHADTGQLQHVLMAAAICACTNRVPYECDTLCECLHAALTILAIIFNSKAPEVEAFLTANDFDIRLSFAALVSCQ